MDYIKNEILSMLTRYETGFYNSYKNDSYDKAERYFFMYLGVCKCAIKQSFIDSDDAQQIINRMRQTYQKGDLCI